MKRRFCLLLTILLAAGSVPVQADETAFPDLSFDSYFGDTLETYCEENELSPENLTEILPYEYSLNTPVVYQGWEFDKYLAIDRTHEIIYGGGYRLTVDAADEKLETLVKDLAENLTLTFGEPYVNEYVDTGVLKITEMESIEEAREATRALSTWEGTYQFENIPEYEGMPLVEWIYLDLRFEEETAYLTLRRCLEYDRNRANNLSYAVDLLKETWSELYAADENTDGYLEIKNTRVIELHKNEVEEFQDIDCVIEFMLYSDYFGTAPYYQHAGIYEDIVCYKNGSMEILKKDPFQHYASTHYSTDYVELIQYVNDLKDEYNQVLWLK